MSNVLTIGQIRRGMESGISEPCYQPLDVVSEVALQYLSNDMSISLNYLQALNYLGCLSIDSVTNLADVVVDAFPLDKVRSIIKAFADSQNTSVNAFTKSLIAEEYYHSSHLEIVKGIEKLLEDDEEQDLKRLKLQKKFEQMSVYVARGFYFCADLEEMLKENISKRDKHHLYNDLLKRSIAELKFSKDDIRPGQHVAVFQRILQRHLLLIQTNVLSNDSLFISTLFPLAKECVDSLTSGVKPTGVGKCVVGLETLIQFFSIPEIEIPKDVLDFAKSFLENRSDQDPLEIIEVCKKLKAMPNVI